MAKIERLLIQSYEIEIHYKKMKNIYLKIKPDGRLLISAPLKTSKKYLIEFIESRIPWIEAGLEKIAQRQEPLMQLAENEMLLFGQPFKGSLSEKQLQNLLHEKIVFYHQKYWQFFKEHDCESIEIKYRMMKSTWGVCRPIAGTITFNKRLVHQPESFIEYVVLHELCHLLVPNHSRDFYNLIKLHMPHFKKYQSDRIIYS